MLTPIEPKIISPTEAVPVEEQRKAKRVANQFDGLVIAVGALGLLALAYTVQAIMNPFVLVIVIFVLLVPLREYRAASKLLWIAGLVFSFWFLHSLFAILVPFLLGALLAYLFNPLVTKLDRSRHINRPWSALIITLAFLAVVVAIGWAFIPSLIIQTQAFIVKLSLFIKQHADSLDQRHVRRFLLSLGLPANLVDQTILPEAGPQLKEILGTAPRFIFDILEKLPTYLERTLNLIIVPVAMYYFLRDWPKITKLVIELTPAGDLKRRREVFRNIDRILYSYLRGQATVAIMVGVLGAIAYSILGIPYAALLGVVLAVCDLVPIIGMVFSMFVVELVIFLTMQLNFGVIASGILVIVGLHVVEVYFVGPRIVGEGIGIPPIVMILSLLIFGYFLGLMGMLIAVPATAVLLLFLNEYRKLQAESNVE